MASTVKQCITLKGSSEIVAEFFHYGINSILYQRGLYPPETFAHKQQYGLTLLVTTNEELVKYLKTVIGQVKTWLQNLTVQKLVLVIKRVDSNEVIERWQFDIECDKTADDKTKRDKTEKEVKEEIKSIIRQITATVTFLPLLESVYDLFMKMERFLKTGRGRRPSLLDNFDSSDDELRLNSFVTNSHFSGRVLSYCSFDVLIYTDRDTDVPTNWGESGPLFIANSEEVRLRSFSTTIHKVDAMVAFKKTD